MWSFLSGTTGNQDWKERVLVRGGGRGPARAGCRGRLAWSQWSLTSPEPCSALLLCPCCRRIESLGGLKTANSRVFGPGKLDFMHVNINHREPLREGQFGLVGELNAVELSGELTPRDSTTPVRSAQGGEQERSVRCILL